MEVEIFSGDSTEAMEQEQVQTFYEEKLAAVGFENAGFTYLQPIQESADAQMPQSRTEWMVENTQTLPTDSGKEGMPIVLQNINLRIVKGEYVAFTGQSGCGKSTLLKLLLCLYPLDAGSQYLEKIDGSRLPLTSAYRSLFAYVPQGNQLMSGTIREIVAFHDVRKMQNEEFLWKSLSIACAEEFVRELPEGLNTRLGERGVGLSEGQMQRIAIARAVCSGNPILMLDESTSALDEATERQLLQNLRSMTDKTVLIVTHRPAVLAICDRQVEMVDGVVKRDRKTEEESKDA